MTRLVLFAGEHDGVYLFVTPSWSGRDEDYEVTVDPKTWMVKCNCFGANRHHLYSDLLHPGSNAGCKHSRQVARMVQSYMEQK